MNKRLTCDSCNVEFVFDTTRAHKIVLYDADSNEAVVYFEINCPTCAQTYRKETPAPVYLDEKYNVKKDVSLKESKDMIPSALKI